MTIPNPTSRVIPLSVLPCPRWAIRLWPALLLLLLASTANGFTTSGQPPGGLDTRPTSVSADGQTVVGVSVIGPGPNDRRAFRWRHGDAIALLADPPGLTGGTRATSVSHDGRLIVGRTIGESTSRALLWDDGVPVVLPPLPGDTWATADQISDDGLVIAGISGGDVVRWIAGIPEPVTPQPLATRVVTGLSEDGSVISINREYQGVRPPFYQLVPLLEAYVWEAGVLTATLDIYDVDTADDISANGDVAIGAVFPYEPVPSGLAGYRWEAGEVTYLALPDGGPVVTTFPSDLSRDGSIIVGTVGTSPDGCCAFVWDAVGGVRDLQQATGAGVGSHELYSATSVTPDGTVVVGAARDANDHFVAYRLELTPSAAVPTLSRWGLALLTAGLVAVAAQGLFVHAARAEAQRRISARR